MKRPLFLLIEALVSILLLISCATEPTQKISEPLPPSAISVIPSTEQVPVVDPTPEAPASTATDQTPDVDPYNEAPTPTDSEPIPAVDLIGQTGPNDGPIFQSDALFLEVGPVIGSLLSFDDAISWCNELTASTGISYRIPTIAELQAIYNQLVLTGISTFDWGYFWSSDETEDGLVRILNFDTGFEGKFYKTMDFLGVIPVTEIKFSDM